MSPAPRPLRVLPLRLGGATLTLLALAGAAPLSAQQAPGVPGAPGAKVPAPEAATAAAQTPTQAPAAATRPLAPGDSIPLDPAVRAGVLPNGLRYYVRANAKPEKRAELRLVVNAGSVLEDGDQRGLAHFVEHMAFNGSTHFKKHELVNYLESIGMRFGPDLNASTSFDETVYMLTLPTDSAAALDKGLLILQDWARGLTFDSAAVERERAVVEEEWRLGQGAGARIQNKQFPVVFQGSRYATRLPIGTKGSLDAASVTALRRFYRDWYRPDLMAVVAVGDFDAGQVEARIKQQFAPLASPASRRPRTLFPVPDHDETLVAVATDREATSSSVAVLYKLPLEPEGTVAAYRASLVEALYNAMLNRRLAELAQRANPPYIAAGSSKGRLIRSKEVYSIAAVVPDGGIERGLEAVLTEAERVDKFGFTAGELDRVRSELLRGYERAYAEREKTYSSALVDEYVDNFLSGEPAPGIAYEYRAAEQLLPTVTLDEVNRLGREWISDRNRVLLVAAPEKAGAKVPDRAALLAVFDRVRGQRVTAWVDSASAEPLLATAPEGGRIVSERKIPEVGVTEWRLSNGARVLIKPTDFQADQVLMRAYSPGGSSLTSDRDYVPAATASAVVTQGGVGRFSLVNLQKKLAGKAVSVAPTISESEEGVSGQASPRDLETLFQLTYLYFTAPRADSAAFASFQQRARAALANRGASPEAAFQDTLQVTLAQHHVRARPLTAQLVDEMSLARSLAVYRDRFADASDFTFVLVGNVSADSLRPLAERYLATLPSTHRKEKARDPGISPPTGVVERTVRRGTEPKAQTAVVFTGPIAFTRANRYALNSLVDVLDIQLRETLREELGGTYGVQVQGSAEREPKERYAISIGFGSAPDRAEQLTKALFAQLDTLKARGPKAETLAKVKEAQRRSRETSLQQNGYWLSQIAFFDANGWPIADIPDADKLISALDARTVQEAARRYLNEENYVRVVLLPEK